MDPQNETHVFRNSQRTLSGSINTSIPCSSSENLFSEYNLIDVVRQDQTTSSETSWQNYTDILRRDVPTRIESSEQLLGQRNIREGFEQFRISLDNTREGQTFLSFAKNLFPFLLLFFAKIIHDNFRKIVQFVALYGFFFQADFYVRRIVAGANVLKIFKIVYCSGLIVLTVFYFKEFSLQDFDFFCTFALNIKYFLSGDYKHITMTSTLYGILMVDTSFKIITILPKSLILLFSDDHISFQKKRKFLQFTEYCSEFYRCALPFGPWLRFFLFDDRGSNFMVFSFLFTYITLKIGEAYRYFFLVKQSFYSLLKGNTFGTFAKDCNKRECVVCCGTLINPVELECKHVFCKICIETWLDHNTTCPVCRAEVAKDMNNEWKNGGTSLALRLF